MTNLLTICVAFANWEEKILRMSADVIDEQAHFINKLQSSADRNLNYIFFIIH